MAVEIVDAPPPAAPPPPTTSIHVTEQQVVDHGPLPDDPKPGSARAKMLDALRSKAKDPGAAPEPPKPPTPPAAQKKPTPEPPKPEPGEVEDEPPKAELPKTETEKPLTPEEKKRVNPWKLVDQYKTRTSALEKEISELKTSALPEKERTELTGRLEKAESRVKELEDHIRYVDYSQSAEFKSKYQEPYDAAWTRAMGELKELSISDGNGNERPIQPQDILDLVNLPLPKARELAEELYGSFANDVMAHRKEIRNLFESQSKALEEAKKNGTEHFKKLSEEFKKTQETIGTDVKAKWNQASEAMLRDEKYGLYFSEVEGDAEINQRLAKGYALVDRAFGENPYAPNLNAEQRLGIIKRHAAVRHRAAAFGRVRYELEKANDKIKSLEEDLAKFRGSEPGTGGTVRAEAGGQVPTSARESVFAALRAKAK